MDRRNFLKNLGIYPLAGVAIGSASAAEAKSDYVIKIPLDGSKTHFKAAPSAFQVAMTQGAGGANALKWSSNKDAWGYDIFRGAYNGTLSTAQRIAANVTGNTYTDSSATAGQPYAYWVKALNNAGDEVESAQFLVSGFSAKGTASSKGILLSWSSSGSAVLSGYQIYRNTVSNFQGARVLAQVATSQNSYLDTSAQNGSQYFYWILGFNSVGTIPSRDILPAGGNEAFASGIWNYQPGSFSAAIAAVSGGNQVVWTSSQYATGYDVWRGPYNGTLSGASQIASGITGNSFTDTSAVAGQGYAYWVKASNSAGSVTASTRFNVTSLSASGDSANKAVNLSWSANASAGISSIKILRATSNSFSAASAIGTVSPSATSYADTTASRGTVYYYWLIGTNAAGTIPSENILPAGNSGASASGGWDYVPGSFQAAVASGSGGNKVVWTSSQYATSYDVLRSAYDGSLSGATRIASDITGNSFTDTSAVAGQGYAYWIKAKNFKGSATANTQFYVTSLSASGDAAANAVDLSWSATIGSGVTGLSLYRASTGKFSDAVSLKQLSRSATSYQDTSATRGVTYTYWLLAYNSAGSIPSKDIPPAGDAAAQSAAGWDYAPGSFQAAVASVSGGIEVVWTSSQYASSYDIYRGAYDGSLSSATKIASSQTGNSFTDTSAVAGQGYAYWVKAKNLKGSVTASTRFNVTSLSASGDSANKAVNLSWSASASADISSIKILRATSNSFSAASAIGTVSPSATSYADTTASRGTVYYYWLIGTNAAGTIPSENILPAGNSGASASGGWDYVPGSFQAAVTVGSGGNKVVWTSSLYATSYDVLRSAYDGSLSGATRIASDITGNSFTDTSAVAGQGYAYWIKAKNFKGSATATTQFYLTGFSVKGNNSGKSVDLAWTVNGGAPISGFKLYRATSNSFSSATLLSSPSANATTYSDTSAAHGVTYYYWLIGQNGAGSLPSEGIPPAGGSSATGSGIWDYSPGSFSAAVASASTGKTVVWTPSQYASSYDVYRGAYNGTFSGATKIASNLTGTSFNDTSVTAADNAAYWVVANNVAGNATATTQFYVTGLSAASSTSNQAVELSWTPNGSAAAALALYRNTSNSFSGASQIATPGAGATTYQDASAKIGVTYYYWLLATNAAGSIPSENILPTGGASGTTQGGWDYVPGNFTAALASASTGKNVVWTPSQYATGYDVYRGTYNGTLSGATKIASDLTGTSFNDTGVSAGTSAAYWVVAKNLKGSITATTQFYLTGFSVKGNNSGNSVDLAWTVNGGAPVSGFKLYRATSNSFSSATLLASPAASAASYSDTSAANGTTYYYWLTAQNAAGELPSENALPAGGASATGSGIWNYAPGSFTAAVASASTGKNVVWTPSQYASSYDVYRGAYAGGFASSSTTKIASDVSGTSYNDTSVPAGTACTYWVVAKNVAGSIRADTQFYVSGFTVNGNNSAKSVDLSWTLNSAGAPRTGLKLYRNTSNSFSGASVLATLSASATSYSDTSAANGTTYYYWLIAQNAAGTIPSQNILPAGGTSATGSGIWDYAPGSFSAAVASAPSGKNVVWTSSQYASSYDVYRGAYNGGFSGATRIASGITGTSYNDTAVAAGSAYAYWVVASNVAGSATANTQFYLTSFSVSGSNSGHAVDLTWAMSGSAPRTGLKLYRNTSNSFSGASLLANLSASATSFSDTTAANGTTYYYWLLAANAAGTIPSQNILPAGGSGATGSGIWDYAPGGFQAALASASSGKLIKWTSSQYATSYDVYRGAYNGGFSGATRIASGITGTSYNDTAVAAGSAYAYWVVARNIAGSATATTQFYLTGFSVGVSGSNIVIRWTRNGGAPLGGYHLYRSTSNSFSGASLHATLGSGATSYSDSSTSTGVTYYYWLVGYDSAGVLPSEGALPSGAGSTGHAYRQSPPGAFSVSEAAKTSGARITTFDGNEITWTSSSGASYYRVYRDSTLICSQTTSLSYLDTGAASSTYYIYYVHAVNAAGTTVESCTTPNFAK